MRLREDRAEALTPDDGGQQTPTLSGRLADDVVAISAATLSPDVVQRARLALLDTVGAMLAGAAYSRPAELTRQVLLAEDGGGRATVVGHPAPAGARVAAFCNGVTAHALDVDDSHRLATGYHPGATVIPAALALAEQTGAGISRVIKAIVAGYEVGGRVGRAMNPSHRYRGFHSTGTVGALGAAAAAAKVLDLRAEQVQAAIGIAASMSGGIFAFLDGMHPTKHVHAGHAAQSGVVAAQLAAAGMTGPAAVLEGPDGFLSAFADDYDAGKVTAGLGSFEEILFNYFKIHVACGHSFGAIDAALRLRAEGVPPDDVRSVHVQTYRAGAVLTMTRPDTVQQAEFSIPFLVALALVAGEVTIDSIRRGLADDRVLRLAAACVTEEDNDMTARFPAQRPARVEVSLADGARRDAVVDLPASIAAADPDAVIAKFEAMTAPLIGANASQQVIQDVMSGAGTLADILAHHPAEQAAIA